MIKFGFFFYLKLLTVASVEGRMKLKIELCLLV